MPESAPKMKGKGGLQKKVLGLPVWLWAVGLVGGLLLGSYLRSRGGGSAAPASGDAGTAGAGASPSDNGLGSSSVDLSGFMQQQEAFFQDLAGQISDLTNAVQANANMGMYPDPYGYGPLPDAGTGTATTSDATVTFTPAAIKQAWASYWAAQKRQGLATQTRPQAPTRQGTIAKVIGGAWTQISKPQKAIHVAAHGGERAHWALPSGRWVSGPGWF